MTVTIVVCQDYIKILSHRHWQHLWNIRGASVLIQKSMNFWPNGVRGVRGEGYIDGGLSGGGGGGGGWGEWWWLVKTKFTADMRDHQSAADICIYYWAWAPVLWFLSLFKHIFLCTTSTSVTMCLFSKYTSLSLFNKFVWKIDFRENDLRWSGRVFEFISSMCILHGILVNSQGHHGNICYYTL